MDLSESIRNILYFAQNNTVAAIALTLMVIFFLYRRPKTFFSILFLGLFLAGLFYLIMNVAGSGSEQKKRIIREKGHFSLESALDLTCNEV